MLDPLSSHFCAHGIYEWYPNAPNQVHIQSEYIEASTICAPSELKHDPSNQILIYLKIFWVSHSK